jgi:orotate phosphoribosyltransferase
MSTDTRTALHRLLIERSLIFGPITLSSGKQSNHYFDCRRTTLNGEGAWLIGELVFQEIRKLPALPSAVGGLTLGADPIVTATTLRARENGVKLDGFYVRKEPKKHGTGNAIENAPAPGSRVVIVEDVVTGAGSILKAIDAAEAAECEVLAAICIIDRLEGGGDKLRARVPRYVPLFTLDDFRPEIERYTRESAPTETHS